MANQFTPIFGALWLLLVIYSIYTKSGKLGLLAVVALIAMFAYSMNRALHDVVQEAQSKH